MTAFECVRCDAPIAPDEGRLTVRVTLTRDGEREELATARLCGNCAEGVEDHLALETTVHECP